MFVPQNRPYARFVISGNVDYTILGASLKGRQPNGLTVPELKRWLSCRGGTVCGTKADLMK